MTLNDICHEYGAKNLQGELSKFLVHFKNPQITQAQLQDVLSTHSATTNKGGCTKYITIY